MSGWESRIGAVAREIGAAGWMLGTVFEDPAGIVRFRAVGLQGELAFFDVARRAMAEAAPFDWSGYWSPEVPKSPPNVVLTLDEADALGDRTVGNTARMRGLYDQAEMIDQLRVLLYDGPDGAFLGWLGFFPDAGQRFSETERALLQSRVPQLIEAAREGVARQDGRVVTAITRPTAGGPYQASIDQRGRGKSRVGLVALPGLPQTPSSMWPLVDGLEVTTLNVRPPGYEGAPEPSLPYDWDAAAEAIEREITRLHEGPVALLGMSGGAYRALHLAVRGKLELAGLFLVGPIDGLATPEEREGFRQFAQLMRGGGPLGGLFLQRVVTAATAEARPELADELQAWIDCVPVEVLASELETFAERPLLRGLLGDVDVPTVLRVGSADVATPPSYARAIAEALPTATVQVVDHAGHALTWEDLEGTKAAIASWFQDLAG
jgi:pimeloyl-ACP methyl ester carboxylesterase